MHPEEIRSHLDSQPFVPLRVHVSDGSSYELQDRLHALLWSRQFIIGLDIGPNDIPRRGVYIDPNHVTRIEPIINGEGMRPNGSR